MGEGGVKNRENFADVFYVWSQYNFIILLQILRETSFRAASSVASCMPFKFDEVFEEG